MLFNEKDIKLIEKALDVTLIENQLKYLRGEHVDEQFFTYRQTGSTFIYCIKLALSEGEPLDFIKKNLTDRKYSNSTYNTWFSHTFYGIWKKLKEADLPVRPILAIHVQNRIVSDGYYNIPIKNSFELKELDGMEVTLKYIESTEDNLGMLSAVSKSDNSIYVIKCEAIKKG